MTKDADAFRTISEVAVELDLPQHVLRFWETRFPQIKPLKRAGGRRYYRRRDIEILRVIKHLLYRDGYTIRGVQRVLKEQLSSAAAAIPDVAYEGESESSVSATREAPLLPHSQLPENDGQSPRPVYSSGEPSAPEPLTILEGDDAARMGAGDSAQALTLTMEDVGRLRAALAEVAACEDILEAARRR